MRRPSLVEEEPSRSVVAEDAEGLAVGQQDRRGEWFLVGRERHAGPAAIRARLHGGSTVPGQSPRPMSGSAPPAKIGVSQVRRSPGKWTSGRGRNDPVGTPQEGGEDGIRARSGGARRRPGRRARPPSRPPRRGPPRPRTTWFRPARKARTLPSAKPRNSSAVADAWQAAVTVPRPTWTPAGSGVAGWPPRPDRAAAGARPRRRTAHRGRTPTTRARARRRATRPTAPAGHPGLDLPAQVVATAPGRRRSRTSSADEARAGAADGDDRRSGCRTPSASRAEPADLKKASASSSRSRIGSISPRVAWITASSRRRPSRWRRADGPSPGESARSPVPASRPC